MNNIILSLNDKWEFRCPNGRSFLSAKVPGCVHLDLLHHNFIEDPFVGENEKDVQWVSEKNWDYRCKFFVKEDLFLKRCKQIVFNGIDTFAKVYLNKVLIIEADNMFRPWAVDISEILKLGNNILEVQFRSPLKEILPRLKNNTYNLPADNDQAGGASPYIRKAPFHFGWDWGPCLITSGLWRTVSLIGYDFFNIESFNINQLKVDLKFAEITLETEINSKIKGEAILNVMQEDLGLNKEFKIGITKGLNKVINLLKVNNPKLWWPSGHGDQQIYNFKVNILFNGSIIKLEKQTGFRSVEIIRENDSKGESFFVKVNGKPIFLKGANWIPADSFTTRLKTEDYKSLLQSAVESNMNTLRVWGGGIYEPESFYKICDELGILVWQDFMFACSLYPASKIFLDSVEKEAIYQIQRLKSFACIILWCGNNEVADAWYNWGWKEKLPNDLWNDYKTLFHSILPRICKDYDSKRLYWLSSPGHKIEPPKEGQLYGSGDNHYWGVWHGGDDFEAFDKNIGRLMSEYGMQSYPELSTIKSFYKSKKMNIKSKVMTAHQKASLGNKNVLMYIDRYYLKPNSFESLLTLSQIMQGEAIKTAVEAHRRNMPYCMGTLYWQLNDCWPGASWSSIDYNKNWKVLHYLAKHFFKTILVTVYKGKSNIEVFVINDTDKEKMCTLLIELHDFEGDKKVLFNKNLKIIPLASKRYFFHDIRELISNKDKSQLILRVYVKEGNKILSSNNYLFSRPKELKLPRPDFRIEQKKFRDRTSLKITAKTFLYKVCLTCKNQKGQFSDNYFDMVKGEVKNISFRSEVFNNDKKEFNFSLRTMCDLIE